MLTQFQLFILFVVLDRFFTKGFMISAKKAEEGRGWVELLTCLSQLVLLIAIWWFIAGWLLEPVNIILFGG